jgi:hypothetical protein
MFCLWSSARSLFAMMSLHPPDVVSLEKEQEALRGLSTGTYYLVGTHRVVRLYTVSK